MILRLAAQAMATRFELVLHGEDEALLRAAGEEALLEIEDCEQRLSLFRRDSVLSHVNRNAARDWVAVDADCFALLATCVELSRASGGAFDPSVGSLMRELGFRDGASPAAGAAAVGLHALELDPDRLAVRLTDPGVQLDLGAVAKGHALDLAADLLRDAGIETALLHGGTSSVVAIGAPPGTDGWHVAIGDAQGAPVAVLHDAALGVSSGKGRVVEHDGREIGHVVDPRTGEPCPTDVTAAVIASTGTEADAWSTAALVSGSSLISRPGVSTLFGPISPGARRWRHRSDGPPGSRFVIPSPVSETEETV